MSGCCDDPTITVTVNTSRLEVGNDVQTSSALVTAGIVIARGNLLKLSATNVLTLATAANDWDVIAVASMTAAETTAQAAAGMQIPVFNQGEFDIAAVKLGAVALTPAQYNDAQARGTVRNIELRKVAI
jgi:hypothetical protein